MNNNFVWITASLCLLILLTRSLPFLLEGLMTDRFNRLGKSLPAYIMLLLVIYEINLHSIVHYPYGLPAFAALAILLIAHITLRITLISIICGTLSYILIQYYFF